MDLVNSIVKAVRILDSLKQHGPLSFNEILKCNLLPKSTLFKILHTLETEELIWRDPDSGRYRPGVKLIEWGMGSLSQLEIRKIALPLMQRLSEEINCTIHLAVILHDDVLPIESYESDSGTWPHHTFHGGVGIPAPIHATAAGKAIFAFMDEAKIARIIRERPLLKFTEHTITDISCLHHELEKIRKLGYAISSEEHHELVRAVAAPIRDHAGNVLASLSALGIVTRITPELIPVLAERIKAVADEISRLFGYAA